MRNRILLSALLVLGASLSSGCGAVLGLVVALTDSKPSAPGPYDGHAEVDKAFKAHDLVTLQKQCSGAIPVGSAMKTETCQDATMVEAEDTKDCSKVVALYDKSRQNELEFVTTMGKKLAQCDLYPALFEKIAHWGDAGGKILIAVEEAGMPLEAKFVEYAKSHPGAAFLAIEHDDYAMTHIVEWLLDKKHMGQCKNLGNAVTGASETVRRKALWYFKAADCHAEGVAIAVALLTSDVADSRYVACDTLGELGDAGVVNKLAVLADTDGYTQMEEHEASSGGTYATRVYPVREMCRAAAGKIALRAK